MSYFNLNVVVSALHRSDKSNDGCSPALHVLTELINLQSPQGFFITFHIEQMRAGGCEEEEEWGDSGPELADSNVPPVLTCIVEEGEENRYVGTDE